MRLQFLVGFTEFSVNRIYLTPCKWHFYEKMVNLKFKIVNWYSKRITNDTLRKLFGLKFQRVLICFEKMVTGS